LTKKVYIFVLNQRNSKGFSKGGYLKNPNRQNDIFWSRIRGNEKCAWEKIRI